jgi:Tfp pilus assembly protein PilV
MRRLRARCDTGDTLIEVLVALVILSIGIVGLMTALATHASTTGANRSQAQAEATLLAASEYVKGLPLTACGAPTEKAHSLLPADNLNAKVPHATGFSVSQGAAQSMVTSTTGGCHLLSKVPITVTGDGFTLTLDVVMRS